MEADACSQRSESPDDWVLLNETESSNKESDSDEAENLSYDAEDQNVQSEAKESEIENIPDNSTREEKFDDEISYEKIVEDEDTDSFSILSFCEELLDNIDLVSRIRCYTHKRNTKFNKLLDFLVMLTLAMATGLGVGNFLGKTSNCPQLRNLPRDVSTVSSALQLYTLNNSPAMMLKSVAKEKLYFMLNTERGVKKVTDPNPQRLNYNLNLIHFEFNSSLEPGMQCTQSSSKSSEVAGKLQQEDAVGPENNNNTESIQPPKHTSVSYYAEVFPNVVDIQESRFNEKQKPKATMKVERKDEVESVQKHIKNSKKILHNAIPDISYQLLNSLKYNIKSIIEETQDLILPKPLEGGHLDITDIRLKMVKQMFTMYLKSIENKLDQLHQFSLAPGLKHNEKRKANFNQMIHVVTRSVDEMLKRVLNVKVEKNRRHPSYKLKSIYEKGLNVIESFEKKWLEVKKFELRESSKEHNWNANAKSPQLQKPTEKKNDRKRKVVGENFDKFVQKKFKENQFVEKKFKENQFVQKKFKKEYVCKDV